MESGINFNKEKTLCKEQRPLGWRYKPGDKELLLCIGGFPGSKLHHVCCPGHGFQMPQGQLLVGVSQGPWRGRRGLGSCVHSVLQQFLQAPRLLPGAPEFLCLFSRAGQEQLQGCQLPPCSLPPLWRLCYQLQPGRGLVRRGHSYRQ